MTHMTKLLTEAQINEELGHIPEWAQEGNGLTRTIEFESFAQAIQVVNRVAEIADSEDHHPDMDIRFKVVRFTCSTHYLGGITENDVSMAQEINGVAEQVLG